MAKNEYVITTQVSGDHTITFSDVGYLHVLFCDGAILSGLKLSLDEVPIIKKWCTDVLEQLPSEPSAILVDPVSFERENRGTPMALVCHEDGPMIVMLGPGNMAYRWVLGGEWWSGIRDWCDAVLKGTPDK